MKESAPEIHEIQNSLVFRPEILLRLVDIQTGVKYLYQLHIVLQSIAHNVVIDRHYLGVLFMERNPISILPYAFTSPIFKTLQNNRT